MLYIFLRYSEAKICQLYTLHMYTSSKLETATRHFPYLPSPRPLNPLVGKIR